MTLNYQSNLLAWLAAIAVVTVIFATRLSVVEVRNQAEQITVAENTVKGVANFRFLIMESAFYSEPRSVEQWQLRVASFKKMLATQRYTETSQNELLRREQNNLEVLIRLFARLVPASTESVPTLHVNAMNNEITANTVNALFLTTQDMLDDAFELLRLNRLDMAAAQERSVLVMQISIAVLAALIAMGFLIIKRRVLVPIAALKIGTDRVAKGDLAFRLNLVVANEIGSLANTFDQMTEQLKQSYDSTQTTLQMLANKSIELTRMQQELQTIIDHMPALVGSWDVGFINRFGNQAYVEWFDISPEHMRGKHMQDIKGQERFEQIKPRLMSVLQGNQEVFERTITYPSGEKRHAVFSYVPNVENGVVKGFYGFVSDVTLLKEAQIGREKSLTQLQNIVDAAKDFAIMETDEEGIITLFSRGAEILFGYAAEEIVGKTNGGIFHLREEIVARSEELSLQFGRRIRGFDTFVTLARQGESESRDWTCVRKDGSTVPVNLTATAIRDGQGNITGYLGVAKDIQEEKEILRTLAETRDKAEASSLSKSQFLANMSHEIRTPMNAILGMLQLLQHTELTARQLDYAVKTQTAAQSLLGLLNDILDFSKVEANKMTLEHVPFCFDMLMRELSVIFSSNIGSKDVEVLFSMDPQLPSYVLGDVLRLRQVLINLAGNAIKFTKQGEVVISLRVVAQEEHRTEIIFAVQDSGIGIAPEYLTYIFEGFSQAEASTTRRFGGTGLGLAISQRLVALMGGELTVESTLNVGSRFQFTLGFDHVAEGETNISGLSLVNDLPDPLNKPLKVLIVDDNDSAREVLLNMAQSLGWQGDGVSSGHAALAILQASPFPYDVVFMDWRMPGMDGWETTRQIRQLQHGNSAPVVIMVTAHGREILAERLQTERNLLNGFLVKPVTTSMLVDAVADASHAPLRITAKQGSKRLAGLRLLVVEDTIMNQQVAQELLSNEGAMVEVADNGGAGVMKTLAADPPFDAVLMDIQMPDMDGYAATGKIRQDVRMQSLPIIAMTANAMAADKIACRAAGMNDHIAKPIDLDEVVMTILRHCRSDTRHNNVHVDSATPHHSSAAAPQNDMQNNRQEIEFDAALRRLGGNRSLFANLAQRFDSDVTPMMVNLRQCLALGDAVKASGLMHTLKGIAGTLGAVDLANYAANLETQLKNAAPITSIDSIIDDLVSRVTQTNNALKSMVFDATPPAPSPKITGSDTQAQIPVLDIFTLLNELSELDTQLKNANMTAISVFVAMEKKYGATLGDKLLPLARAIDRLDFKLAIECSQGLRTSLQ